MTLVQIRRKESPSVPISGFTPFALGFRPFFLGAGVWAIVSVLSWMVTYSFGVPVVTAPFSLLEWHAHQMVYGFSMAVIAGFLLTAVANWTGVRTVVGAKLGVLVATWAGARLSLIFGSSGLGVAAFCDAIFFVGLVIAILHPIITSRQWRQIGIVSKVVLLGFGSLSFYLDGFGIFEQGAFLGVYGGLFLIISLILTIGGRVMSTFISQGLDATVKVHNPFWVAVATFFVFLVFVIDLLFISNQTVATLASFVLLGLTTYRLVCWHTTRLWTHPLLYGLYSSFVAINLGFLLLAMVGVGLIDESGRFIAIHSFAYGGIGLSTLAMMIRVSLGHTGRNVRVPPRGTGLIIFALCLGTIIRVVGPLALPEHYRALIISAQVAWIGSFVGFLAICGRMLMTPRVDGRPE